ncbi:MAG: hypothetical protein ACRC10_03890 [Thermoguttaceae bacterium]
MIKMEGGNGENSQNFRNYAQINRKSSVIPLPLVAPLPPVIVDARLQSNLLTVWPKRLFKVFSKNLTNKGVKPMKKVFDYLMSQAKYYTVFDFGCLKMLGVTSGILLGSYFSGFFLKGIAIIWIIMVVSCIEIIWATLRKNS